VVLKGSRTIIAAPAEVSVVSAFGTPALATAGTGDVLSGICGALLVGAKTQGMVFPLAQTAVALHGMAAERWSEQHGDRGLLASEIADQVPDVIRTLLGS
jgi:NAD(P)H-hydrate repair Nnr-like enzyme with NAD(P)H-hydrate dehydratase domain